MICRRCSHLSSCRWESRVGRVASFSSIWVGQASTKVVGSGSMSGIGTAGVGSLYDLCDHFGIRLFRPNPKMIPRAFRQKRPPTPERRCFSALTRHMDCLIAFLNTAHSRHSSPASEHIYRMTICSPSSGTTGQSPRVPERGYPAGDDYSRVCVSGFAA
jgi:hypothetical protein